MAGSVITSILAIVFAAFAVMAEAEPLTSPSAGLSLQQRVAAVISGQLIPGQATSADSVVLLTPGLHLPPQARLRLVSGHAGYLPGTWLLRMECLPRGDCLPFHVLLRAAVEPSWSPAGNIFRHISSSAGRRFRALPEPSKPMTHSGDRVLLVQQLPGMRLQVKAVCLQSGNLGQSILVRNLASRRVLLATIAGKELVRVE